MDAVLVCYEALRRFLVSKWIIGTLLVVATVTWAQTRKSDPRLPHMLEQSRSILLIRKHYLLLVYRKLGLDVRSGKDPRALLRSFSNEIRRFPPRNSSHSHGAKVGTPNISITFRVSISGHTPPISGARIAPIREENDAEGHFFTLKDLDGNEVTIWGE